MVNITEGSEKAGLLLVTTKDILRMFILAFVYIIIQRLSIAIPMHYSLPSDRS